MSPLAAIVFVLGMIYLAAIVLAIRDRIVPQPQYESRTPRLAQHPHFRTIRWFVLPIWLPLALFSLAMYGIVFLPVFIWRGASTLVYRLARHLS